MDDDNRQSADPVVDDTREPQNQKRVSDGLATDLQPGDGFRAGRRVSSASAPFGAPSGPVRVSALMRLLRSGMRSA